MGWLLTLLLALPQAEAPVRVEMWFSRESYCTFAAKKFTEQPMYSQATGQPRMPVNVTDSSCRELGPNEIDRVPPHMRDRVAKPDTDTGF